MKQYEQSNKYYVSIPPSFCLQLTAIPKLVVTSDKNQKQHAQINTDCRIIP